MKIHQNAQNMKAYSNKTQERPHTYRFWGNTHEDEAQTHPITAMTKTVQGGATQGAAAPPAALRAHLPHVGSLIAAKDSCMRILENIPP
jgi:hypothetical protein